jgi:hypothetical protein
MVSVQTLTIDMAHVWGNWGNIDRGLQLKGFQGSNNDRGTCVVIGRFPYSIGYTGRFPSCCHPAHAVHRHAAHPSARAECLLQPRLNQPRRTRRQSAARPAGAP